VLQFWNIAQSISTKIDDLYIVALRYGFFCYDVHRALIAQLDRVQVSEACGVGSSPAERTIFLFYPFRIYLKSIKNK
jgi:hypothetical protein